MNFCPTKNLGDRFGWDTWNDHASELVAFAGHLTWEDINFRLSRTHGTEPAFSCFTMLRHPLTRVRSCFYYRRLFGSSRKEMSQFSGPELRARFAEGRDLYGHGCLNEVFRIFGPDPWARNETFLNTFGTGEDDLESPLANHLIQTVVARMSRCVVGIQDIENGQSYSKSFRLLGRTQPWLDPYLDASIHLQTGSRKSSQMNLPEGVLQVLLELTFLETQVYTAMVKLYKQQQKEAMNTGMVA